MSSSLKEQSKKSFELNGKTYTFYSLNTLDELGLSNVDKLPYSIRVLLESVLRQFDGRVIKEEHIMNLAKWGKSNDENAEVPFKPSRVILQDFTGVPAVVDLASLRKAMDDVGGDVSKINPEVPVDLVIDHSVQVDSYALPNSLEMNMKLEFERNIERYQFLNWATKSFDNYRAVPPATGIVHQVNLEYLASVVHIREEENELVTYPDTLVGTDSHTTMINGIGVLGWGVGGIEAEAGMLGQPSYFPVPEVIGVKLTNELPQGTTATDLALRVTEELRKKGVVGKFVEFFGPGVEKLPLADRATIANMAPEYGATCGFFPVDEESLSYLRLTGRSEEQVQVVEKYLKENNMFFKAEKVEPTYTDVVDLDLSTVEASLSGPKRPQDLIKLSNMKESFVDSVTAPAGNQGHGFDKSEFDKTVDIELADGRKTSMTTGDIA
ncbi:MAG: aconitase family protein, partial [Mammaliicoccus vitulinus]